eukprot:scaffold88458_cov61-Phaeocystis_antarctica.AAC.1
MTTQTVGAFLKVKLSNLAVWIIESLGKENINMDLEQFVNRRSEVEITFFADILSSNSAKVVHRDWAGLVGILSTDATIPSDVSATFIDLLQLVRSRPELHDNSTSMTSARDPLDLAGLDPGIISKTIDDKKGGKSKVPTELEVKKEERLASKESRMAKGLSNPIPPAGKGGQMAPEAGPPPEVYDKSYLLDRLGAYRERFPHLKKRNNVTAKSG